MKAKTLQIIWHGKDPVLSLDFHRSGMLATAGSDKEIKLWDIGVDEEGHPTATYHSSLSHHSSAVNVARFSPAGDFLATGADGGEVVVWKPVQTASSKFPTWKVLKTTSFPCQDVLALEWSPDGTMLLSGSVNHKIAIWDVGKGSIECVFEDHGHYVQGVAWDPRGQFVVSQSSDRTCRVYSRSFLNQKQKVKPAMNLTCQHVLSKVECDPPRMPIVDNGSAAKALQAKIHLFHDENLPSFFRRLAWSPDGSFLVLPAGMYKIQSGGSLESTSYIYSRSDLTRPAVHLPTGGKPTVVVRFCPVVFALLPPSSRKDAGAAVDCGGHSFLLRYKFIFAVATLNSVTLYDTQKTDPIAFIGGLHFATITDLAWSQDAHFLAISSQDGFCTIVVFEDGELGTPLSPSELPRHGLAQLQTNIDGPGTREGQTARGVDGDETVDVATPSLKVQPLLSPTSSPPTLTPERCITGISEETDSGRCDDRDSQSLCATMPLDYHDNKGEERLSPRIKKQRLQADEDTCIQTVKTPQRITPIQC